MFLKKEPFNYQGESTTLNELSALQRIEYLEFLAAEEKALSVESDSISDQGNDSPAGGFKHPERCTRDCAFSLA